MATTTNFGWETPDDTDLVKDGAAAIRTALGGVDTSFIDLKGGTTGQILSKASNTDLDYTWVTTDDANAIQNAIVDAKGDLITATAADTPARLAVGTNGQYLQADSTTSTGLKWATPASGSTFVGVKLGATNSQSIPNNTDTAFLFNTEEFDTDGFHSTATNTSRITIPAGKAGYYQIGGLCDFSNAATGTNILSIFKNGSNTKNFFGAPNTVYPSGIIETVLYLAVGDYVELFSRQTSGTSQNHYVDTLNGQFYAFYIGA